jgi:hypothetical protein
MLTPSQARRGLATSLMLNISHRTTIGMLSNWHVGLLDSASFLRENHRRETKMEEAKIKVLLAQQVVSTGVDIWKENEASPQTNDSVVTKL